MNDCRPISALRARVAAAVLPMMFGSLGCGGPDFSTVLTGGVDAGDDRDNTPIILPPDKPEPMEAGDDGGDAAADGESHTTVDGGTDAAAEGGVDATVEGRGGDASSENATTDGAIDSEGDAAFPEGGAAGGSDANSCAPGSLVCGGACVPNDAHHCGSCGHDCTALSHVSGPVACLTSGACSFPISSCAAGWTHCAGNPDLGCEIDVSTTSNCGGCGMACLGATPVCGRSGGGFGCASGCPASTPTLCGGSCVDDQTDPGHCGGCGTTCGGGTPVCLTGVCVSCAPGARLCNADAGMADSGIDAGVCGNGFVDPGEQCDHGSSNVPEAGAYGMKGACTTRCTFAPYCDDGIVNGPEACDNGGSGSTALGACNPECTGFYTKKIISQTTAVYTGNMGGPSGADTKCQNQFGAGWKAFLVGGSRRATVTPYVGDSPKDWVLQKYTYYYNAQDQLIWRTDSVPLLGVSGGSQQAVGAAVFDPGSTTYAWSGWNADWTTVQDIPANAIGTCVGWTSSSDWGQFITPNLVAANDGCSTMYFVLCVQQ